MNYDTKSYRKRYNIPLDLALGYRNIWADRMPEVINMIGQGSKLKDIGKHYNCTPVNVAAALKAAGHGSIHYVRAALKNNLNKCEITPCIVTSHTLL
jgi:hypothetical protein